MNYSSNIHILLKLVSLLILHPSFPQNLRLFLFLYISQIDSHEDSSFEDPLT